MTPVSFFSEDIKINVHSAMDVNHLKLMTIGEFSNGEPVSLYQNGDELYARKQNGDFIEGKEI